MVSNCMAIPALRQKVMVKQPDGTTVTIMLHGDEWQHFTTTDDGYTVKKNKQGYYVYAQKVDDELRATDIVAHDQVNRTANEVAFLQGVKKYQTPKMSAYNAQMKDSITKHQQQTLNNRRAARYDYNKFRGLVILVTWNDKGFSRDDYPTIINNMVNQENYVGYDDEKFTGSVRDYFSDNSGGKFVPTFDVVGPYTADFSQYDALGGYKGDEEDYNPYAYAKILNDVINQADADVDFSKYDGDGDGIVDLVYFVVAGNGSNYAGNDKRLWWPHRSRLYRVTNNNKLIYLVKDGVVFSDYASSVELYGYTTQPKTVKIDGIGTICHEFSHVLGLPDFYDANYETDGQSNDPNEWSVMASGSYKNYSRTPVGYSLYERWSVGFCDAPETIDVKGDYTLEPLPENQKGFLLPTPLDTEFFLFENRQQSAFKWDKYLPGSGMLVHRVDFSDPSIWSLGSFKKNIINANANHNYYELLRANGAHKSGGYYVDSADDAFPAKNKTELTNETSPANLKTWDGTVNDWAITNISMKNGVITFNVSNYDVVSMAIEPAVVEDLPVGVAKQLKAVMTPVYAKTQLTWSSDDESIATIDENGVVKGINVGTTTIRVQSDNAVEATCQVTVKEISVCSIAEFKQREAGSTMLLNLTDAEVLYVYQNDAYVRGTTGSIILDNKKLNLKKDDHVNGTIRLMSDIRNKMPVAMSTEGTSADALFVTAGSGAQPREVTIDELTEADYCDYVLVKAGRLKYDSGVWVVNSNDEKKARLRNTFNVAGITLKDYDGNYYDIPAIYGTNVVNGSVINELYMLTTPTKVEAPTGIMQIVSSLDDNANSPTYNMAGQRVSNNFKGMIIKDGKKFMSK